MAASPILRTTFRRAFKPDMANVMEGPRLYFVPGPAWEATTAFRQTTAIAEYANGVGQCGQPHLRHGI
jgi:hypothetical protein